MARIRIRHSGLHAGWLGFALLASAVSGGCLSVEAEVAEMEVTHHGLAFEGTPRTPVGDQSSASSSFTHRHTPLDVPSDVEGEIRTLEVTLIARPGTPDLSFIDRLELTILAEQSTESPVVVLDYRRPEGAGTGRELIIPVQESPNAAEQWSTHASEYEVTVWGNLPEQSWSVDITVSFTGKFTYQP